MLRSLLGLGFSRKTLKLSRGYMQPTHLPMKLTDASDAPVSANLFKRIWWRYLHSPYRAFLPPRLLVVLLLSVQVIFLAALKLGPGQGAAWPTLSSLEGRKDLSIRRSVKSLPQERQGPLFFSGRKTVPLMSSMGREHPLLSSSDFPSPSPTPMSFSMSSSSPSSSSSGSTLSSLSEGDQFQAGAVAISMAEYKKDRDQGLIAEEMKKNVLSEGKGELSEQQEAQEVMQEVLTPSASKVSGTAANAPLSLKTEQADQGQGELSTTAEDDAARIVHSAQDPEIELVQRANEDHYSSSKCKYGYIYVYDLPGEYNRDIIANCTALNVFQNVCNTLLNGGLGEALGEASPLGQTGSWFVSDQFTAEIVFHNRILEHGCRTQKPEEATGFYIPFYAGLEIGRFLWGSFSPEWRDHVSNQLLEWLGKQETWKRTVGWGHFMMIGRVTWDFRRYETVDWGSGFFNHPLMQNVTRLLIERHPWDNMEMAVPYPTNFHPQSDADLLAWQNHIRTLKRSNLFSFAGARRRKYRDDFRGMLLDQCQQAGSCQALDCSHDRCINNEKSLQLFMNSTFCLQPRGDSFTRRSTFDCLLAGSIPVFFWHRTAYLQYEWHLPEDVGSYSVFVSKNDMKNGTRIEDVLKSYLADKVQAMQQAVIEIVPRIVYAASGSALKEHKDAFDVAVDGVMKRFHEHNLSLQRR